MSAHLKTRAEQKAKENEELQERVKETEEKLKQVNKSVRRLLIRF